MKLYLLTAKNPHTNVSLYVCVDPKRRSSFFCGWMLKKKTVPRTSLSPETQILLCPRKQPVCEAWFCSWLGLGDKESLSSAHTCPCMYMHAQVHTHTYAQAPFSGCPAPQALVRTLWLTPSSCFWPAAAGRPLAWASCLHSPQDGWIGCRHHT